MIRFFRHIRQSLLSEHRFSRYLLYAIGEIALVMIGILLALQVSNWNQSQKDRSLEQQYLLALKEEFLINVEKLKELDNFLGHQLEATNEYIKNTHPNKIQLDDSRFSFLMGAGFRDTHNYAPSSGVMKDLINSGKLGLIRNAQLRRTLADWDSHISTLKEFEDEAKKSSYDVVEILRTKGNFRQQMNIAFKDLGTGPTHFDTSNTGLLKNEVFENSIVYFTAVTWRLKNVFYPKLINRMEDVLAIIEEEIK